MAGLEGSGEWVVGESDGAGEKTPTVWSRTNPTSPRKWPGAGFAISFEMKHLPVFCSHSRPRDSLVTSRRVDVPQVMSDA